MQRIFLEFFWYKREFLIYLYSKRILYSRICSTFLLFLFWFSFPESIYILQEWIEFIGELIDRNSIMMSEYGFRNMTKIMCLSYPINILKKFFSPYSPWFWCSHKRHIDHLLIRIERDAVFPTSTSRKYNFGTHLFCYTETIFLQKRNTVYIIHKIVSSKKWSNRGLNMVFHLKWTMFKKSKKIIHVSSICWCTQGKVFCIFTFLCSYESHNFMELSRDNGFYIERSTKISNNINVSFGGISFFWKIGFTEMY